MITNISFFIPYFFEDYDWYYPALPRTLRSHKKIARWTRALKCILQSRNLYVNKAYRIIRFHLHCELAVNILDVEMKRLFVMQPNNEMFIHISMLNLWFQLGYSTTDYVPMKISAITGESGIPEFFVSKWHWIEKYVFASSVVSLWKVLKVTLGWIRRMLIYR